MPIKGKGRFFPVIITLVLMFLFFLLPLLRVMFPKFNTYFGFIPVFFFLPFFWSFRGRRRTPRSEKNRSAAGESDDFPPSGSVNGENGAFYYDSGTATSSPWSYAKYLAIILAIALGAVTYFFLIH